jgi:hypothetical protein
LALVTLGVAVVVLWSSVMSPLVGLLLSLDEWHAETRASIQEQRSLAAQEPSLRTSLGALNQSPVWALFSRGESTGDASAELEREVRKLQTEAGLAVRAIEIRPVTPNGATNRHVVTVRASARIGQLSGFLTALHTSSVHPRLEHLRIYAPTSGVRSGSEELELSFDVARYVMAAPDRGTP